LRFGSRLSEDLREKYQKRSVTPRVGDTVRIERGEFRGIEGKVTKVVPSLGLLSVEGVTREKLKGGTALVPIRSSNVVITSLSLGDNARKKKVEEKL
jgi:large subunit ribosomal protein L24